MRIRLILFYVGMLLSLQGLPQTATVTLYYTGAQSRGCCSVCGTDYMCIGSSGCGCCQASQQTKTFSNPVPAGNIVTAIRITYYAADCSAANVPTTINGTAVCTAVNTGAHSCYCGSCNATTCYATFPCGFPGYNYSGINTLYANPQPYGTEICTQRVVIQLTYQPNSSGAPAQPGTISGPTSICPGQSYTYSIAAVTGATSYAWTVPAGSTITSGQGTTSITITAGSSGGNICVSASNSCGSSAQSCIAVNIAPAPAQPGPITGPVSLCAGQSYTYSISAVTGATSYNWTVPAGTTITSGQGTTSITITAGATSGSICVTASNACGTSTARCVSITIAAPPAAPGSISGTLAVCPGQTLTYSISAVPGATSYTWTVPAGTTINSGQGTTSISVTFGTTTGNICVSATNSCGNSSSTCITLNLAPPPAAPGPITGTTAVCPGQTFTYTISAVTGATSYAWTVPSGATINSGQGTTSITVTFGATGGNICVTASNSCGTSTATCLTIVISPPPAPPGSITGPLTVCAGTNQTYSISAVTGATSYNWTIPNGWILNSGQGTTSVSINFAVGSGQLCVNASNACGTSTYTCINITVNPNPVVTASPANPSFCAGGSVQLSASGAGSYSWSPANGLSGTNISNPIANPASTTTYTVTGTTSGCTATASVTVTVHPLPTANAGPNGNVGVCASSTYTLNGSGTGNAPLGYSWSPSSGLSNPNIANPVAHPSITTTYTLTVTDTYGCTATSAVTVTVNALPTASAGNDATIGICASSTTVLNGSGTGSGPLSYAWSPTTGLSNPNSATPTAHPMSTTTYTLTVTDIYGCTATDNVVITVDPLPTANAGNDASIGTCVSSNATLSGSGSGTAPLSYSWSPAAGLSNPNIANPVAHPASTTTYTLTVTDTYGCTATDAVTITVNPLPAANAGTDVTIGACSGSTTTLSGSGTGSAPFIYSWSPAGSLSNPNIPNPVASPGVTTTYTLTVTDMYGCTATDAVVVTVNAAVSANAGNNVNIGTCISSITTLNGSGTGAGPFGYVWSPSSGLSNPNIANPTAHPNSTTTYTLTVTDIYGCTATDAVTVTLDPLPTANAGTDAAIGACAGSTTTLNGSGTGTAPLSYSWSPSAGLSNPAVANPVAKPANTTTYTLTVTDTYGCTATDNVIITVDPLPTANAGNDASIGTCVSSNATLSGSGTGTAPLGYSWSPAAGLSNPNIANPVAHPASTTTYTLTVTDTYGCTATDAVIITVNPLPAANAGTDVTIGACAGSTTTLSGSGTGSAPFIYTWSPAGSLSNPNIPNPVASPGVTTTYTLTVTDMYGCTATDAVVVTVNAAVSANAGNNVNIGTCITSTTTLNGSGTGAGPLGYLWSPSSGLSNPNIANPTAHPNSTTTYTLTVTDIYGCTATDDVTVTLDPLPTANAGTDAAIGACAGSTTTLNGSGTGTAPLSYSWSPSAGLSNPAVANPVAKPANTTTYTLTVTDTYGCTATDNVVITVDPAPVVSAGQDTTIGMCSGSNATLYGAAFGSGPFTYAWSPAAGLSNPSIPVPAAHPASTTTYTLTATDVYGCTASDAVVVTVSGYPVASAGNDVSIGTCSTSSTTLNGSATGSGPFTYAWSPAGGLSNPNINNPVAHPATTTTYTLTVTDKFGCTGTDNVVVTLDPLPTANAGPDGTIGLCAASSFTLSGSGTGTGITYSWNPATGLSDPAIANPVAQPVVTTNYSLVIVDIYGCLAVDVATVTVTPLPVITVTPTAPGICPGGSVTLTASGGLSYTWAPGTGLSATIGSSVSASPASTTTYTVTGSDQFTCTSSTTVTVVVNPNPVVSIQPLNPGICINSSTQLTATGATSYAWSPATGLSSVNGSQVTASPLSTVTYTVTGTLGSCTSASTVTVTVFPLPVINFPSLANVCVNAPSFTLNTATPAGGTYTGTGVNAGTFSPAMAGAGTHAITYTFTDGNSCTNSATQNISVVALPVVQVSPANPNICVGGSGVLTASGASTYTWSPATGLSSSTGSTVTCSPAGPITYTVTGTQNGCSASTTVTINTTSGLQVQVIPSHPFICPGTSVSLTATGGLNYTWTPAAGLNTSTGSSVIATPASTTTYNIVGSDASGCTGTASVTVEVYPGGGITFSMQPRQGCLPLGVGFEFIPGPDIMDSSWIWNFGDYQFSNNSSADLTPSHIYTTSGSFPVTITAFTTAGCVVSFTDTVHAFLTPTADFMARPEITTSDYPKIDFIDQSLHATSWAWNFGNPSTDHDNKSTLQNPFHIYSDTGTFQVILIVQNQGRCSDTVKHSVRINEAYGFFIPNAFSPNDDGRNDVFQPVGIGLRSSEFEMHIFDRWGRMVFSTTNPDEGWDGTDSYSGNVCAQGIYSYIINTKDISGVKHRYIGIVTIII